MVEYAVVLQTNPDPNLNFVLGLDSVANLQHPHRVVGEKEAFRKQLKSQMQEQGIECMIIIGSKQFLLENPFHLSEEDFNGIEDAPAEPEGFGEPWYGYIHVDGTLHVKRYLSPEDLVEAYDSKFVEHVIGPFHATGPQHAASLAHRRWMNGTY